MEPVKDAQKVGKMFAQGQPFLIDPQSGYKYTMLASCPKDGAYCSVEQVEREGQSLSKVVFHCSSCFNEFEAKKNEIFVC
jgi:hypothetical protein